MKRRWVSKQCKNQFCFASAIPTSGMRQPRPACWLGYCNSKGACPMAVLGNVCPGGCKSQGHQTIGSWKHHAFRHLLLNFMPWHKGQARMKEVTCNRYNCWLISTTPGTNYKSNRGFLGNKSRQLRAEPTESAWLKRQPESSMETKLRAEAMAQVF